MYARTSENYSGLASALTPLSPTLRGAPAGLPFTLDETTLHAGLNFTLDTTAGPLDLLGEIAGGGTYESLREFVVDVTLFGLTVKCLTLRKLIEVKRAAGRVKDLEAIGELELLLGKL